MHGVHLLVVAPAVATLCASGPEHGQLITRLGDPDFRVREEASRQLATDPTAGPWVRKATRHPDPEIASRARALLPGYSKQRQAAAPKAVAAAIKAGQADLFLEWFFFWQPASQDDLWTAAYDFGALGVKVQHDLLPKGAISKLGAVNELGVKLPQSFMALKEMRAGLIRTQDGPVVGPRAPLGEEWLIRADTLGPNLRSIALAAIRGPISQPYLFNGYLFSLDSISLVNNGLGGSVALCDGDFTPPVPGQPRREPRGVSHSLIVCRGNVTGPYFGVGNAVILAGGDVHLEHTHQLRDSAILAGGTVHMPKRGKITNCRIEGNLKDATAPFKFFELADVGVKVAKPAKDGGKGLAVDAVTPDTPFAKAGVLDGDVILAIDDAPVTDPEAFRKQVRRALVVQGDCLLTVSRGGKTLDLPAYFPLPQ
jgi:hypothetical protein